MVSLRHRVGVNHNCIDAFAVLCGMFAPLIEAYSTISNYSKQVVNVHLYAERNVSV